MEQARLWLAGMGAGAQNYPSAESSSEQSPDSFYASEFPRISGSGNLDFRENLF
jgi:hypothetical protein